MSQPTQTNQLPPHLPAPPRPPTAAALRQSWRELPVRVWTLLTLGVLVVVVVVAVRNVSQGLSDRQLLRDGVRVDARVDLIYGASKSVDRSVSRDLKLSFLLPGESERRVIEHTTLTPVVGSMDPGAIVPIAVDPKHWRESWTDRLDPPGWLTTLAVPLLFSPAVLALAAGTAWRRRRFVSLYERGAAATARVVDVHKSALTPGQKVMKLSLVGGDGRVFSAARPDALGERPAVGQTLAVIVDDAARPRRAVIADAYV